VSRSADSLSGLVLERRSAEAELRATIGAAPGVALPIADDAPRQVLPAEPDETLRAAAADHPRVAAMALMSRASSEMAESAAADRYPSFTVGAEYIVTGEARMAGVQDSGKDPIIVMLGVKLPLWGGSYSEEVAAARADSAAFRAREAAERDRAKAETDQALADVRDAARRVLLYRDTLVPQAESVYTSVLGSYQSDRATLAAVLLAERELLELQLGLFRAQADHATAWARLEAAVGRPVRTREVS
jgi:outer membrane protein TolC